MELPAFLTLRRVLALTTLFTFISFFALLITANAVNRRGIKEIQLLEKDIAAYSVQIRELDRDIATYSSLKRVEQRAKELGLGQFKKIEYLK
jgi:cell division protein FtsL